MTEQHLLVDHENVQPGMEDLLKIAPKLTDVWLFHGANQTKRAEQVKAAHERVTLVPHTGKGKNALDFHLSFYLGYVAARHPDATLVVVANDKGYDSMLSHAKLLGFTARRVGFKASKAPAVKAVAPAKTTPAKKAPAKAVPARKAAAPKPNPQAQPKAPTASASKAFNRLKTGLTRMGDKRPRKLASFLRHVQAILGKDSPAAAVEAAVRELERANVVHIAGDLALYS